MNVAAKPQPACRGFGVGRWMWSSGDARSDRGENQKADGSVKYVAMDEPLWYGYYYESKFGGQLPAGALSEMSLDHRSQP
jgi:hypothetical protein